MLIKRFTRSPMEATHPGTVTLSTGHWQLTKPSLLGSLFRYASASPSTKARHAASFTLMLWTPF